jgi:uncharacterized protein
MDIQASAEVPSDYLKIVMPILSNEEFRSLEYYSHHRGTSRLMHSVNVSYIAWLLAGKVGCDKKKAARVGLLHDFCPYDFREKTPTGEHQAFYHPKAAAENSIRVFQIDAGEADDILTHMFPLAHVPKSREGWIVTLADKVCAVMELCRVPIALARKNKLIFIPS